jgi:hypothetical protein
LGKDDPVNQWSALTNRRLKRLGSIMHHDLRFAIRSLAKTPGFTAVAIAALALGIGANTTVFSLANAVMFKTLPFAHSERILYIAGSDLKTGRDTGGVSYPDYRDFRAQVKSFGGLGAFRVNTVPTAVIGVMARGIQFPTESQLWLPLVASAGEKREGRHLLVESVLLSLAGGAVGWLLANRGIHAFDAVVIPTGKPQWIDFSMDYRVFGYLAALSIGTGVLFGLAPALRVSKLDVSTALKEGGRGAGAARRGRFLSGPVKANLPQAWLTVVGVVPDILQNNSNWVQRDPILYLPYRQEPQRYLVILARTRVPAASLGGTLRRTVQAVDQDLPVRNVITLEDQLALMHWPVRVFGSMFAIFALMALALASVGLYAVIAHAVSQRTHEIGVRVALGASAGGILRLVLAQGLRQMAIGLAAGLAAALGITRVLSALLVGVSPTDPVTFVTVALVLIASALLGCAIPARRAMLVDPVVALRDE